MFGGIIQASGVKHFTKSDESPVMKDSFVCNSIFLISSMGSSGRADKESMERPAMQKATMSVENRMNVDRRSWCFFEVMMFDVL